MAIKITQADGSELMFDTVEEFEAVTKLQEESDRLIGKSRESAVAPKFSVGDKVRLTDNQNPVTVNAEIGDVGEIVGESPFSKRPSVDFSGCTPIYSQTADPSQLELVEPIAQDANGEDLYEGDLVTGIDDEKYLFTTSEALMKVEKIRGITSRIGVSVLNHVSEEFEGRTARVYPEYFVKTTEEEYYKTHNTVIEVGSKVIALKDSLDVTEGNVYTVNRIDRDGDYAFDDDEGDPNYFAKENEGLSFRLATDEEVADAEREESVLKFEVGDKVRVIGESKTHYHRIGDVGEVVNTDESILGKFDDPQPYGVDVRGMTQHHVEKDIELVSDSKDFQAGDIVMVNEEIKAGVEGLFKKGEYVEVLNGHLSGIPMLANRGGWKLEYTCNHLDKLTLVCRAEDRLDTEDF